jgi:hypothetical protein
VGCAKVALEKSKTFQLRNAMQQNRQKLTESDVKAGGPSYILEKDDGKRSRSIDLFLRHQRAEMESAVESLDDYLSTVKSAFPTSHSLSFASGSDGSLEIASRLGLYQVLSRVLYFGFDGKGDFDGGMSTSSASIKEETLTGSNVSQSSLTAQLIFALRDKFGLDLIQKKETTATSNLQYESG